MAMRRFQLMIDAELDAALGREARLRRISKADLVRRTLRAQLPALPPIERDPLWEMVGADDDPGDDGSPIDIDAVVYDR